MKVMILGYDGYIGYPLTMHLLRRGHEVFGIDNMSRRRRVSDLGSESLTPIVNLSVRRGRFATSFSRWLGAVGLHLGKDSPTYIRSTLDDVQPHVIIHLAEQPSAPWSMIDPFKAAKTQQENVIGTLHLLWAMKEECPDAHLIKLGTMGEYGTPDCDIPEGVIPKGCLNPHIKHPCIMHGLLFPRTPGSFYHLSKVHDTHNIHFACRNWGLRSTDIMQGIVYGLMPVENEYEYTRFDYDECFGTVLNRFVVQALANIPLTVYGSGTQTRGFLPLKDSIQCITIALENPPDQGEYRTLNQFEEVYSINKLADYVVSAALEHDMSAGIMHIGNPRKEAEKHYYNPDHTKLFELGYKPTIDIKSEIYRLLKTLIPFKDRIRKNVIQPKINWR